MAEVYWIHLPEHTDMFSEGYIGMTRKTAKVRFYEHKSSAKSGNSNLPILNAIRKYGDKLIVETLVICSSEYAVWLENKLRPEKAIGWNLAVGGEFPSVDRVITEEAREHMRVAQTGRNHTDEAKKKIGEANSRRVWTEESRAKASKSKMGTILSEEARNKISLAGIGRTQSPESIEKTKIGKFYFYLKKNKKVYSQAEELYEYYLTGLTYSKAEKVLGLKGGSLQRIFDYFKKGWIPTEDAIWKEEYQTNSEESLWPTN
jgi:hypothetical protein